MLSKQTAKKTTKFIDKQLSWLFTGQSSMLVLPDPQSHLRTKLHQRPLIQRPSFDIRYGFTNHLMEVPGDPTQGDPSNN